MTNHFIKFAVILFILIHTTCGVVWIATGETYFISIVNILSASTLLAYNLRQKLSVGQRIYELRETSFLGAEFIFLILSIYSLINIQTPLWLEVMLHVVFALHLLSLIMFLTFILTFKIKKLF